MSDDELIDYAYKLYGNNVTKGELFKKDRGLYKVLWRRELLDRISGSDNRVQLEQILDQYIGRENG
jgi:hypothetical protein